LKLAQGRVMDFSFVGIVELAERQKSLAYSIFLP
jgi:hypothetical protein